MPQYLESYELKFYCGALAHLGGPLGPFGSGLKINFISGLLPIVRVPNSNLTLELCPSLGPELILLRGFCPF
jgi:hypothetical protein